MQQNKKSKSGKEEKKLEKLTPAGHSLGNEKANPPAPVPGGHCFEDGVRAGTEASSVQCCPQAAEVGCRAGSRQEGGSHSRRESPGGLGL